MTEINSQTPLNDVCLPETLAEENPKLFTSGQVNWLVKTRHKNGLAEADAVLKISGRHYLRKSKFFDWFMQQKAA